MKTENKPFFLLKISPQILLSFIILIILFTIRYCFNNYFVFHSIIEIYGLIIAYITFIIIWNSRQFIKDQFFSIIGLTFFFIAVFNLFQYLLSFKDENFLINLNEILFIHFWKNVRYLLIFYIICFCIVIIIRKKFELNKNILLVIMIIIMAITISELFYIFNSMDKILNTIGHFIKFISSFILYKIIIEKRLKEPYIMLLKEIKASEDKCKTIIDNTDDLIILTKYDGEIFYINSSCKNILECEPAKLLNKNIKTIYKDMKSSKEKILDILKKDKGNNYEFNIKTFNGKSKNILHSWTTIINNNEKIIVNILKDMTSIKQFEKEKEKYIKEILEKNKDLEQIIYIISHDLRTPLTNIQGFTKAIFYSLDKIINFFNDLTISKNIQENVKNIFNNEIPLFKNYIDNSVVKIDSLITGLLKLSQIGRSALNFTSIDTNKLIKEVISLFKYQIQIENINIKVKNLPSCFGDIVQINQVFSNLIDNAIKYQDEKKQKVIKIYGRKTKNRIIFCVEDNGIGIEKKFHKEIFEIFKRIHPDKTAGEGLGLTIINKIISRHNGEIKVESTLGKGSKFYIYLPRINL